MDDSKRQTQREVVRQWFLVHPGYAKVHQANQEKLRAELGVARDGTIPVKATKRISYSINVRNPLKLGERVSPPRNAATVQPKRRKKKTNEPHYTHNSDEEFYAWDI